MGDATERPRAIDVRDYFAAAALQGLLAHGGMLPDAAIIARTAYEYADAMIQHKKTSDAPVATP
jgi:hypothetical protein